MKVDQKETPGLGGRIAEVEFLNQFNNKKFSPKIMITSTGSVNSNCKIDGISGATMTCRAFENILNEAADKYFPFIKEMQQ